jgi:hypothetical protein
MPQWVSGRPKQSIGCFRAGELVTVLLGHPSGTEAPSTAGLPPCLRFEPETTTSLLEKPHAVHSTSDTDEVFYRFDLAPFWMPYHGTLYLEGGGGAGEITYQVTVRRTSPRVIPVAAAGPRFLTLRDVSNPGLSGSSVELPPGCAALHVPVDGQIKITAAGEVKRLDVTAGQRLGISNFAAAGGTIEAVTPTTARIIMCEVWL